MTSKKINLSLNRDIKQPILRNFFSSKLKSEDNRFVALLHRAIHYENEQVAQIFDFFKFVAAMIL